MKLPVSSELRCDFFKDTSFPKEVMQYYLSSSSTEECNPNTKCLLPKTLLFPQSFLEAHDLMVQLNHSCLELTESEDPTKLDAEDLLKVQSHRLGNYATTKKNLHFLSSSTETGRPASSRPSHVVFRCDYWFGPFCRVFMLTWGSVQPESLSQTDSVSMLLMSPSSFSPLLSFDHRNCCLRSTSSCPVEPSRITAKSPPFWTWWKTQWCL